MSLALCNTLSCNFISYLILNYVIMDLKVDLMLVFWITWRGSLSPYVLAWELVLSKVLHDGTFVSRVGQGASKVSCDCGLRMLYPILLEVVILYLDSDVLILQVVHALWVFLLSHVRWWDHLIPSLTVILARMIEVLSRCRYTWCLHM